MAKCLMFLSRCVAFSLPWMGCVHNHCLMSKIEGEPCKLWMPPCQRHGTAKTMWVCRHLFCTLETSCSLARGLREEADIFRGKKELTTHKARKTFHRWTKITFYRFGFMLKCRDKPHLRCLHLTLCSAQIIPSADREQICSSVMTTSASATKRQSFTFLSFYLFLIWFILSDILTEISAFRSTRKTSSDRYQSTSNHWTTTPLIHPSIFLSIHASVLVSWEGSQWQRSKQCNTDICFPYITPKMAKRKNPGQARGTISQWGKHVTTQMIENKTSLFHPVGCLFSHTLYSFGSFLVCFCFSWCGIGPFQWILTLSYIHNLLCLGLGDTTWFWECTPI